MTEDIYQNLVRNIYKDAPMSIHLCDFPEVNEAYINKELEDEMEKVLDIVVMGRACRNASNIKNRQPIAQMYVKAEYELGDFYKEIVIDELNVKKIDFTQDVRNFTSYSFKPQLKTVGPKYGKQLGGIKTYLAELDGNAAMDELNAAGALKFTVGDTEVELTKDDLLIEMTQIEGYVSENNNKITVVLDTNLTEELIEEGNVREVISKIQTMRKEADFEVMDKITLYVNNNDVIAGIVERNKDYILSEVMAKDIVIGEMDGFVKEWNINGYDVTLGVKR
jgi:isoleucyl-tRNA synthetase